MKLNKANFFKCLNKNSFENNPLIAVAVSGGPDSIALLILLNEWCKLIKGEIIVLIVDHNLRFNSSYEANFVKKIIEKKKIRSKILKVKKNKIIKKSMGEARTNRYDLLTSFCRKNNILHLFVAHHYDDNLETYLNRKISGSDFEGLESIKQLSLINRTIINRPLLNFSKSDIIQFNLSNKLQFVKDPSNTNIKYTRPVIRKFLETTSPKILKEIKNDFDIIKKNSVIYKLMIYEILLKNITKVDKNNIILDFKNFLKIELLLSVKIIQKIYQFFYDYKLFLRSKKIELFLKEIKNKKFRIYNLGGMIIKKDMNYLIFSKKGD